MLGWKRQIGQAKKSWQCSAINAVIQDNAGHKLKGIACRQNEEANIALVFVIKKGRRIAADHARGPGQISTRIKGGLIENFCIIYARIVKGGWERGMGVRKTNWKIVLNIFDSTFEGEKSYDHQLLQLFQCQSYMLPMTLEFFSFLQHLGKVFLI